MGLTIYELHVLLGKVSMGLQALALGLGFVRWTTRSGSQRWLILLIGLILLNQLVAFYFGKRLGNNYPFFFAYILFEGLGILWLFSRRAEPPLGRRALWALMLAFAAFWGVDVLWLESWWVYPTLIRPVESLLIIFLAAAYYRQLLNRLEETRPTRTFMFWACTGWLVYFMATLLIEGMGILLVDAEPETWGLIFTVRNGFNVLLYGILAVSLWLPDRPATAS